MIIVTVSEQFNSYARKVMNELKNEGIRVELDDDNQTLNYKLRKHILAKAPLIAIIGKNEELNNTVTIRSLESENQKVVSVSELITSLKEETK